MLIDLKSGSIGSERTDPEWAKNTLDPSRRDLIDHTWDARPNPDITIRQPTDIQDFESTLEFVRYVIEESKKEIFNSA